MSNFHALPDILSALATIPVESGAAGTVKVLADGERLGAVILKFEGADVRMHRQPEHEELLIVLEGEASFQVAEEIRQVRRGDFIFVPRGAMHGTLSIDAAPLSMLSIMAPKLFDPTKDVVWEKGAAPRYQLA